jgi:hypothetical protein
MLHADGCSTDGCRLFRVIAPPGPDLAIHCGPRLREVGAPSNARASG